MLGAELGESLLHQSLDVNFLALALKALCVSSGNDLGENTESYLLACLNAAVGKIVTEHKLGTNGIVTEYLNLTVELGLNGNLVYKAVLDSDSKLAGDLLACLCNDFTRKGINNRLGKGKALDSSRESNLSVVFVTSNRRKIVSLGVEEHIIHKYLGRLNVGRLAGAELLIDLLKSFIAVGCSVLLSKSRALVLKHSSLERLLVTEHSDDGIVVVLAGCCKGTDKYTYGKLAVLVDLNVEETCRIALILKPRTSVRNNG